MYVCVCTAVCLPVRCTEWRGVRWRPLLCLANASQRHRHAARKRLGLQVLLRSPLLFSHPNKILVIYGPLAVTGAVVEAVELMLGRLF